MHIAGAVRRDGSDAPRTWPVLVARSFGLRPYPRQVSDDGAMDPAHPAQVGQSFVARGPCRHTRKRVNQTRPAAGSAAGAVGVAASVSEAGHELSGRPALGHPLHTRSPPRSVCGLSRQLRCSASRPTAVVVPLPGQLPRHGKPGVGLGDLQLSAPQVLLDVDVGPALLSIDLLVERLAAGTAPRTLAAWRRPRSAPSTPTWLTTLARSIRTFSPRTTAADVSMPSGCASRRGRLAVPIDRLATTSLQRLRSRTGPPVWWRPADPPCGACAPATHQAPTCQGRMATSNAEEVSADAERVRAHPDRGRQGRPCRPGAR